LRILSLQEAAAVEGISLATLRRKIKRGEQRSFTSRPAGASGCARHADREPQTALHDNGGA
jgi:hypothetical protein